ncbi:branched-chain amino acid ABC transporter substrate-binding protein [Rhodovulum sp.]|uniref:branched-chain amino acid ABC transporter substrate-binding protein n=1 Tax=Rhodovulum sp. TaxID=34009 RepID=UPI0017B3600B|nr:branched-chain amino acid ABC transporter substrate-binding protein [Rhodovulum sp.]HDR28045.1 branched-chain amino acid ABC transporter substrate-binding protein [Rhodovulum sp.]
MAQEVRTAVIRVDYPSLLPLSRLDLPTEDRAFAGATLGTEDNATTGRFMGQTHETVTVATTPEDALAAFERLVGDGYRLFVILAREAELLAMADAYRASARNFGARIVGEREFTDTGGSRVSDSGHVLVQRQLPVFMQNTARHDVVLAADATDYFAEYLPYNTWQAAPVAGSAGLVPVTWAPTHESRGATQLNTRFEKLTNRPMRDEDYQTWLALRVIGEAVTRTGSADPAELRACALGDAFTLAAFKGEPVTFRKWNGQMRQPILLTNGRMTVSVSPQDGFLHQRTLLDSLGLDQPESA